MNDRQKLAEDTLQSVEIFNGLNPDEIQRLLSICIFQSFEESHTIYSVDAPSDDMFILLTGRLLVRSKTREILGMVLPGMPTGEMGLFTGRPRSADVITDEASTGLLMRRLDLVPIFQKDLQLHNRLLQNIVELLCKRIMDANWYIDTYALVVHEIQNEIETTLGQVKKDAS